MVDPGNNRLPDLSRRDCQDYECPDTRPIAGSLVTGFDTLIVNGDALVESDYHDGPLFWFEITSATSSPIDGRGLVVGVDPSGRYCDVHIALCGAVPISVTTFACPKASRRC